MITPTTMLYRPADKPNPHVWGWKVETGIFPDEKVTAAILDGWSRHPLEAAPKSELAEEPKRKGRPPKEG